jgi:hypothetical protein
MSDLETLEALNRDYISSVQNGDVRARQGGRWLAVSAHVTRC